MKFIAAIALLLASLTANAEVVTLGADACGTLRVCQDVPNDTGASITLASTRVAGPTLTYPATTITIDGVAYSGTMPTAGNYDVFDADVTNDVGEVAHLYAQWHSVRTYVNSGRAHYYITRWYLDFGTFTRP